MRGQKIKEKLWYVNMYYDIEIEIGESEKEREEREKKVGTKRSQNRTKPHNDVPTTSVNDERRRPRLVAEPGSRGV